MMFLIYIKKIGGMVNGKYRYDFHFYQQENLSTMNFSDEFSLKPYCLNNSTDMVENIRTKVMTLYTEIKLSLIQENCCLSFKNCVDGICSLGYEDISEYEVYPEEGRLFFNYLEPIEEVKEKLQAKGLTFD